MGYEPWVGGQLIDRRRSGGDVIIVGILELEIHSSRKAQEA